MARKYVVCPAGHRNDRAGGRTRCAEAECRLPLRKLPQQKHKLILRDGYEPFNRAAREIHGVTDESCCVCGKPRTQERHHDRDHDHITGLARGLACPGDNGCNVLMAKWVTPATARGIYEAKLAAGESDAERWRMIAEYLERVRDYLSALAAAGGRSTQ
jgi:hypothetical protein